MQINEIRRILTKAVGRRMFIIFDDGDIQVFGGRPGTKLVTWWPFGRVDDPATHSKLQAMR